MGNADRLFRNTVFGGFNKDDVIDYIENMKNEFFEYRSQVEQTITELNETVATLKNEALCAKKEAADAVASSKAAIAEADRRVARAEIMSAENAAKDEPDAAEEINSAADKLRRVADELCNSLTGFLDRIAESSIAVTVAQPIQSGGTEEAEKTEEKKPEESPSLIKEKEADILSFIDSILNSAGESESSETLKKEEEPSLLDSLLPENLFN